MKIKAFLNTFNTPLLSTFAYEFTKASTVLFIPRLKYKLLILFAFYATSGLGSLIEGKISDSRHRTKTLLFTNSCLVLYSLLVLALLLSQINFQLQSLLFFFISSLFLGAFANSDVIALGLTTDLIKHHKIDKASITPFGSIFFILPFAWITSAFFFNFANPISVFGIGAILSFMAWLSSISAIDQDPKDKTKFNKKEDSLKKFINLTIITMGISFLLYEVGFQNIYLFKDFSPHTSILATTQRFGWSMAIGTLIQMIPPIRKRADLEIIILGYGIELFAILTVLTLLFLKHHGLTHINLENSIQPYLIEFSFSIGSGLYLPRMFLFFSKQYGYHLQGTLFAILGIVMILGETFAALMLRLPLFSINSLRNLTTSFILLLAGIFIAGSTYLHQRFKK